MKPAPESGFEQLDRAITMMRDALWEYRFVHEELGLDRYKSGTTPMPDSCGNRVRALVKSLSNAANNLQAAAQAVEAQLSDGKGNEERNRDNDHRPESAT